MGLRATNSFIKQLWLVRPFTRQKNRARIRRKSGADRITFAVYADEVLQRVGPKAWFPYRCICRICRVCRTKKIHRTDITLWKPPVRMLNTKETTYTTCCTI